MYPLFLLIACSSLNLEMNYKPIADFLVDLPGITENSDIYKKMEIGYKIVQTDLESLSKYVGNKGNVAVIDETILKICFESNEAFFVGMLFDESATAWKGRELKENIKAIINVAIQCKITNEYTIIGILNFLSFCKYDMHDILPERVPEFFSRCAWGRPLQKIIKGQNEVPYPIASVFDKRKLLFKREEAPSPLRLFIDHQRLPLAVLVVDAIIYYFLTYYKDYPPFIPYATMIYSFIFWIIPRDNLYYYFQGLKSQRDLLFSELEENFLDNREKLELLEKLKTLDELGMLEELKKLHKLEMFNDLKMLKKLKTLDELKTLKDAFDKIKEESQNIKKLVSPNKSTFLNPLNLAKKYKIDVTSLDLRSLEMQLIQSWKNRYEILKNELDKAIEIWELFHNLRASKTSLINKLDKKMVLTLLCAEKLDEDYKNLFNCSYDKEALGQTYGILDVKKLNLKSLAERLNIIWKEKYNDLLLGLQNPTDEQNLTSSLSEKLKSLNNTFNHKLKSVRKPTEKMKSLSRFVEKLYEDWTKFLESTMDENEKLDFNQKYGINDVSFNLKSLEIKLSQILKEKYENLLNELDKEIKIQQFAKKRIASELKKLQRNLCKQLTETRLLTNKLPKLAQELSEDWQNLLEYTVDKNYFNIKYGIDIESFDLESLESELIEVLNKEYQKLIKVLIRISEGYEKLIKVPRGRALSSPLPFQILDEELKELIRVTRRRALSSTLP